MCKGELSLLLALSGSGHGQLGVFVFLQASAPGGRSALRDGVQATRWRSDSAVSPEWPCLTDPAACGLPEGHSILLADHNTQTDPFMTLLYPLHFNRKHTTACPARLIQTRAFLVLTSVTSFTVTFSSLAAQVSQCSPPHPRFLDVYFSISSHKRRQTSGGQTS